jgi:hypothetical protein
MKDSEKGLFAFLIYVYHERDGDEPYDYYDNYLFEELDKSKFVNLQRYINNVEKYLVESIIMDLEILFHTDKIKTFSNTL